MASKVHSAGSIKADIVAKSADFNKALSKVERRLLDFKKVGNKIGRSLKKTFNPKVLFGGLLSGAAFAAGMKNAAAFGAKMEEAGKKVGIASTEVRDLSTLMEGDGIGMERVLNTLTRANKRIGDVQNEMRGPLTKLEKSGFSEADIANWMAVIKDDGNDVIDVLDKMGKVALEKNFSQAQIGSFFDALAGEDGRSMGAWVVQAIEAHGDLREAMADAGRFETTTAEEYADLKGLDQKFLEIGKNIKDFIHKGMAGLAEPLTKIIDDVNKWLLKVKTDPEFGNNLAEAVQNVANGFVRAFELATDILEVIESIINGFQGLANWWKNNKDLSQEEAGNRPGIWTLTGGGASSPSGGVQIGGVSSGVGVAVAGQATEWTMPEGDPAYDFRPFIENDAAPLPGRHHGWGRTIIRGDNGDDFLFDPAAPVEPLHMDDMITTLEGNIGNIEKELDDFAQNWVSGRPFNISSGGGGGGINPGQMNAAADAFARIGGEFEGVSAALRAFVTGAEQELGGFKSFIQNIAQTILNNVIENTIVQPLSQGISGGINTFFDTLWSGGDGGGGVKSMFGGFFDDIFGFADGGRARGGLALVGERGPEVVDFSRPGMVYSNEQLRAAFGGGGGGTSIVYNIQSTDGPGVRAALSEATPAIVNQAAALVGDRASRPGGYRQQIRGVA